MAGRLPAVATFEAYRSSTHRLQMAIGHRQAIISTLGFASERPLREDTPAVPPARALHDSTRPQLGRMHPTRAADGPQVVTVNDYLARRDSEWVGQVSRFLGLSVAVIQSGDNEDARRAAYQSDITYVTNSELGFGACMDASRLWHASREHTERLILGSVSGPGSLAVWSHVKVS